MFQTFLVFSIILAIIGVPLSYLAMKIERKEVNLPLASWIRIFFTFVLSGMITMYIYKEVQKGM